MKKTTNQFYGVIQMSKPLNQEILLLIFFRIRRSPLKKTNHKLLSKKLLKQLSNQNNSRGNKCRMRPKKEILLSYLKDYPNNPLLLQRTFTNNNQINNSNTLSNKFLNNFKKKCTRFKIRTRNNYICSSSKLLRDKDKKNNSRNNNNTYSNSRNYNNSRVINIINSKWWDNYLGE